MKSRIRSILKDANDIAEVLGIKGSGTLKAISLASLRILLILDLYLGNSEVQEGYGVC